MLFHVVCRYHAGGPMSVRGFSGYGIGPRSPSSTVLTSSSLKMDDRSNQGDSMGGFAKSTFLGTLSVPLDLKVREQKQKHLFYERRLSIIPKHISYHET